MDLMDCVEYLYMETTNYSKNQREYSPSYTIMTARNIASNSHLYSPKIAPEIATGPSPRIRTRL